MLAVWLMVLTVAGTAVAGSFEDALSAQEHGDYATALRLYEPLADQGDASAQYSLGVLYDTGQGVPLDYVEAHKWYDLAAAGLSKAEGREEAIQRRDKCAAAMTPTEIAEARKRAREFKPK
jgi:hypothetical protein